MMRLDFLRRTMGRQERPIRCALVKDWAATQAPAIARIPRDRRPRARRRPRRPGDARADRQPGAQPAGALSVLA